MKSIRAQLGWGLFLGLMLAFIVIGTFTSNTLRDMTTEQLHSRLTHDAESLLASVKVDGADSDPIDPAIGIVYNQPFSGHYYHIQTADKLYRSRSLWDQSLTVPDDVPAQGALYYLSGPQAQPLLAWVKRYTKKGQPLIIVVAEDLTAMEKAIERFHLRFFTGTGIILVLLIISAYWVLTRALQPMHQLQADLRALERQSIKHLDTRVPVELVPLLKEINQLHATLQARTEKHRNALTDLAHALKKPLTVIQHLSRSPELSSLPEIQKTLSRQAETTRNLTQRILHRARLAGDAPGLAPFDFDSDLTGLLDTLAIMHQEKGVTLEHRIIGSSERLYDREDFQELLGNLLDNAYKWAKSQVLLQVSGEGEELRITIEDDGAGVREEHLPLMNMRGIRLDETIEGQGLGLAIVTDIVSHYNGKLHFGISEQLGGLKVTLIFPGKTDRWHH